MKMNKLIKNTSQFIVLLPISFMVLSQDGFPEVNNYWLRAAPPNAMMQAAYGELTNNTNGDLVLTNAYSPAFGMTEIHKTVITDGVARMIHQGELIIKKGAKLNFQPGGLHIMLMHPIIKFQQGDRIKINFIYQQNDKRIIQEIWFPVEKK